MTRTGLVVIALGLLAGCSGGRCDAATCTGCCDGSGACVEAVGQRACGTAGAACVACGAGQLCIDGACRASGLGGGAGGGAGSGGGSGGLEAWQQALLTAHDQVRSNAMPAPSPALSALTWNAQAQAVAQAWADRCTWSHNPAADNTWGENIHASTGEPSPAQVVSDWAAEVADYDYATNRCAAGKACGHYTQIVWRDTSSVGCASKRCAVNSPFGSGAWTFWVCDYAPPGNVVGRRPY